MVAVTQAICLQKCMSCCSPAPDQEEEDEPQPLQPFEWTESCCSPMAHQEEEGDEPEPPKLNLSSGLKTE